MRPRARARLLRGAAWAALSSAVLVAAVFGGAHLLTDRSTIARAIAWMESDIGDIERFPAQRIARGPDVTPLPRAEAPPGLDAPVPGESLVGVPLDDYLRGHATRAFLVLQDGRLIYERYFDGGARDRLETSFSMAKSFTSTLVGIAVDEGAIRSLDDPVTRYLPELARRDRRFARIRIRDLLTMSSGIRYVEEGRPWSDDAVTYYGVDLREVALERPTIEGAPGERWRYDNFHPLLLGLVLERATGRSVSELAAEELWQPLGAEADASWSLDSRDSGFEKMESGLNARARDFARFGELFRREGQIGGRRVVSERWVAYATSASHPGDPADFYGAMWWIDPQAGGERDPFFARGKYGQLIAVVPERDAVIVRLGSDDAGVDWAEFALDVAQRL